MLNETIYGHFSTKKQIKCIISQWLSGKYNKGIVIGIQGPPGVGKTTFIKSALSKCLVDFIDYDLENKFTLTIQQKHETYRPFTFISLGGTTNGSTLVGHNITYHGATCGDIVKSLKESKIMNPILYFDELDKISNTEHGREISSVLTHITDPAQNEHFTDRYFTEVKIDLSKCIIIFSYNDSSKIDRILIDRIHEINVNAIKTKEKLEICTKFIMPEILNNMGYNKNDIIINKNNLENIITEYTHEAGVRKLKEKLEEILRTHHLKRIIENKPIAKLINTNIIEDILSEYPKVNLKKIINASKIGYINGLYASTSGIGGITIIQVKPIYHKETLALHTTGSLEKVINESMQVAKTVAWNLLSSDEQKSIIINFKETGLHIHCPDGATPKDGPSAGTAFTCAIYSLFTNKPIRHDIAITGEIDLDGNVTIIGGLDTKLYGAKKANVKTVLVPFENKRDIEIITKKNPDLFDDNFNVKFINHINDAIQIIM